MMEKNNKRLAINGGNPVTGEPVLIHKPLLDEADFDAVSKALRSTFVSGDGPSCREFEKGLTDFLGVKHALFLNSATSALELAFRVKNFKPGSEVIVPDFTYTSSALGALYNNLNVVLADVYPDNGSINVSKIDRLINKRTVAIVPVDYAGIPADMDAINYIAQKYNLYVVHDTAQSIGSAYKGQKTGSLADVSTFSFHGTKNITTGEGGALVTDNDEIAAKVKILREKGTDKYVFVSNNITRGYYEYVDIGNSYVQSNILGALGVTQLKKITYINKIRSEIAEFYIENLKNVPDIELLRVPVECKTNWHIFGILVPAKEKEWIMDSLRAEGIMVNVHYSPLHLNKFYKGFARDQELKGSVEFFNRLLRLPVYPSLTQKEMEFTVQAIKKIFS